jgi:pimeloyl-ACP methyl ester carboxylesterase
MALPEMLRLPDGRVLAHDLVGDPDAPLVLYLHGTPDSRLARHPDDGAVARCGVRLVAIDRPGAGASDPPPAAGWSLADDLEVLLDRLGAERAALLGWSSGGLAALVAATSLGERISSLTTVGTLPPVEAYGDAAVVEALGAGRRAFVEIAVEMLAEGVRPAEIAAEVAVHLVPDPLDAGSARDAVLAGAGPAGRAELAEVPGAADQLVASLLEAVRGGTSGLTALVAEQLAAGCELSEVRCPVVLWHGTDDEVAPPEVGRWLARRLPRAEVHVVPGGHHLLLTRWEEILSGVVAPRGRHC